MKKAFLLVAALLLLKPLEAQYVIKNYPWEFPAVKVEDSIVFGPQLFLIQNLGTSNSFGITDDIPEMSGRRSVVLGSIVTDSALSGSENHILSTFFGSSQLRYLDKVTAVGMYPAGVDGYALSEVDIFGRASAYRVDSASKSMFIGSLAGAFIDSVVSLSSIIGYGAGGGLDHVSKSVILQTPTQGSSNFAGINILDGSTILGQAAGDLPDYITTYTGRFGMDSVSALVWLSDGNGIPAYTREDNSTHTFWDTSGIASMILRNSLTLPRASADINIQNGLGDNVLRLATTSGGSARIEAYDNFTSGGNKTLNITSSENEAIRVNDTTGTNLFVVDRFIKTIDINTLNASINGAPLTDGQALVSDGTSLTAQNILLPPLAPVELTGVATSIGDDDLNGRIFYATAASCTLNIPENIGVTAIVDYVVVENYTASEIIIDPQGSVTLNGAGANQQVLEHRRVILRRIDSNTWEALTSP